MARPRRACSLAPLLVLGALSLGACKGPGLPLPAAAFVVSASSPPARLPRYAPATPHPEVSPLAFPLVGGFSFDGASPLRGEVVLVEPEGERPAAGAWVATSDGRRATADAAGRFTLPGPPPADGLWAAGAPGCHTSVVVGLPADAPLALPLRPRGSARLREDAGPVQAATLSGVVRSPAGEPLPAIAVLVGGARVDGAVPVLTDARGEFQLTFTVPAQGSASATVLAADTRGRWVGLRTGVAVTGGAQRLGPLVVSPADHEVTVGVAEVAGLQAPRVDLALVAPDGTRLSLFEEGGAHRVARLSGGRYDLTVQAASADGQAESWHHLPDLPIDWPAPRTTRTETLLAPPRLPDVVSLPAAGGALSWEPVAGARGYTVEVAPDLPAAALPWEAFTALPALPAALLTAAVPEGAFAAQVTAWGLPGPEAGGLAQFEMRSARAYSAERRARYARRNLVLRR